MYGCESWTIKAEHWRINAFTLWCWRKFLRPLWTTGRSDQSTLKETNPEYSLEGLKAKAESPILWPHNSKSWLIGKDSDRGKDWGQEKGATEDKMVGWCQWLNGHEFELSLGDGERQRSLACCSPWGHKSSDTTEQLSNNNIFNFTSLNETILVSSVLIWLNTWGNNIHKLLVTIY